MSIKILFLEDDRNSVYFIVFYSRMYAYEDRVRLIEYYIYEKVEKIIDVICQFFKIDFHI